MSAATPLSETIRRVQRGAFVVGVVGSLLLFVGWLTDPDAFFRAYLESYLLWLGPALGSLAVVMLHNMTGGAWGFAIKRLLEAGIRVLPWMALLFLPVALGIPRLYEWSHAEVVAEDPVLQHKAPWLNVPFFLARAAFYFVVWSALGLAMVRMSARYDRRLEIGALRRMKSWSAFGLVLYVLTMSFASFDWGMSLEPHWFSTIYGVHFVVGQVLSTLCLAIVLAAGLARHEPFARWIDRSHFHDLGNLLLAFVMLWAYMSFSQFLIIWSGNLPEEVPWYLNRIANGWQVIAVALVLFHFAAPFLILLSRRNKRIASRLASLAIVLFVLRFLDTLWLIAPAFHGGEFVVSWQELVAPFALGGIWLGLFTRNLRGRPLVSLQDAKLLRQLEEAPGT